MWKRIRASLTLRIFCVTAALLAAACALTCGMLVYLTPISYTAMLDDELDAAAGQLIAQLETTTEADSAPLLQRFSRQTGVTALLLPAADADSGAELSMASEDFAVENPSELMSGDVLAEVVISEGIAVAGEEDVVEEISYVGEGGARTQRSYWLRFSDGQAAELVLSSGLRAVNRSAEAMRRLLPYLALALLAFSLAGALIYARFITRPIVDISAIAGRIAAQDFSARWTKRRSDEIGALGDSLNRLSDSLSGALDELRADIERERELERQRLAFFSASSHELKTPVTILKGQLSGMLAQVGAYRDREKYLSRALEVVGRMEGLVGQILTVSRVEAAGAAGDEEVNLSALLEAQLAQDAELIEARELALVADVAPGVTLRGSGKLLSSALDNVLMNAIRHSPEGARLRVTLNANALRVENSGARIAEADLPHLFEPFYRAEKSRNRAHGGSGLGLYLVQRILALHGLTGEIRNTDEGVLFEVKLTIP